MRDVRSAATLVRSSRYPIPAGSQNDAFRRAPISRPPTHALARSLRAQPRLGAELNSPPRRLYIWGSRPDPSHRTSRTQRSATRYRPRPPVTPDDRGPSGLFERARSGDHVAAGEISDLARTFAHQI